MDRFRRLSVRDRRLAGAAIVAAAIVVIVAGAVLTSAPAPVPGLVSASSSPSASTAAGSGAAASGGASPGATALPGSSPVHEADWASFDGAPYVPLVELTADSTDAAGVAATSTFTLRAKAPLDAPSLARSLQITPAAPFGVIPGSDPTTASIRPVAALSAGASYRFALTDANGTDLGSWVFAVKGPLHVVTTLPDNASTDVPLTTGIEITLDQDGATDIASHVTIVPAVRGRAEIHGRTFVFVPDRLTERTLYTVTVHAGIGVTGSDAKLAHDMAFSFETGVPDNAVPPIVISAERLLLEASPRERATMVVDLDVPDGAKPATTLPVAVYRLGSQSTALAALRRLIDSPDWARYSQQGLVDVAPLQRVASFTAKLGSLGVDSPGKWFRFPTALPAGWYIVQITRPDRDLQVFLQSTDLATYAAVTSTRSVVWVNDTKTHAASKAVAVALAGGPSLGRTDSRGVLVAPTPRKILDRLSGDAPTTDAPIFVATAAYGRAAFVPVGFVDERADHYVSDIRGGAGTPDDGFYHLIYTDRTLYRQTDQVNVWGLVRARDRVTLPSGVQITLTSTSSAGNPAIATVPVTLGPTGSFTASIQLSDLPIGVYGVDLWVGDIDLASTTIAIDVIRKPDYQIKVTTDRHAVLVGEAVRVTAHLSFYDGTAVPDTRVEASGFNYNDVPTDGPTDATGSATIKLAARTSPDQEGFDWPTLSVSPVGPEEGAAFGRSNILVFPSSLWLDGKAGVSGGRLVIDGSVHDVDFAALERKARLIMDPSTAASSLDPRGRARTGLTIDAAIDDLVPVRTFAGQAYDFITKQAIDTYTYSTRSVSLGTRHLRSGADGKVHLSLPVAHPGHAFRVSLTVRDATQHTARLTLDADAAPLQATTPDVRPRLSGVNECSSNQSPTTTYAVGATVTTTMIDGRGALPSGGANRYLFLSAQRGLKAATVQASPRFQVRFSEADLPNLSILGVRFTGTTYAPVDAAYDARFDPRSRALSVHLSTNATSYRPGDTVTLTVETRDASGKPVPATVTLRAVDQKLFAIDAAQDVDALTDLYASVSNGIVRTHASRSDIIPTAGDGCGSTGGGGRDEFRDSVLFRSVTTDAVGRATVAFKVGDDLTSWHLSASAVTKGLQAGSSSVLIPVGLPFFADAALAPEYLVGDRPSVRLRAFGSALKTGDPVTFTVSSTTLPLAATTVQGTAFQPIDLALPALREGDQSVTITASSRSGSTARTDTLVRHFIVITSRLLTPQSGYTGVTAGLAPPRGPGATTYVFSDAGRGQFLAFLEEAAASDGARLDQALAKAVAQDLIARYFPSAAGAPTAPFDPSRYESDTALALLPYGGSDLELTADAALVGPDKFRTTFLQDYLQSVVDDREATRERHNIALAGLAGTGEAVLDDIRAAAAATDLTPTERLYLGLGAAALGDDVTARAMEIAELKADGQRQGPWVRLAVGSTGDEKVHATALFSMLAAEVGDPVADAANAWVATHPAKDSVTTLFGIGYVGARIAHAAAVAASFASTVDGVRTVRNLNPGEVFTLTLTGPQASSLRLDPVTGSVGVTSSWAAPADLASTPLDPAATSLTRTWQPGGDVSASSVVAVTLTLELSGRLADGECYEVTDLAPSGMVPVARLADWPPVAGVDLTASNVVDPYAIEGQRVRFCAQPMVGSTTIAMRYYLRVVTTGTYAWEPATASSSLAPNGVARTEPTTVVIR